MRAVKFSLGFDLRSLALMRIAVAGLYLLDLLGNLPHLEAFYCDTGLMPRASLVSSPRPLHWSLYMSYGTINMVGMIYALHLAVVVALMLGYRTRLTSLIGFFMAASLQSRVEVLPGWDGEIRLLLLYGAFLPWGERFTLWPRPKAQDFCLSAATIAWRIQLLTLYLGAGLLKGGAYWADGTAVDVSLHSDAYATVWASRLLQVLKPYPEALVWLNDGVPLVELLVPCLLFVPIPWVQFAGALALGLMHLGFGLCLDIDLFSPVCCACLLCFVPADVWNRLAQRWPQFLPSGEGPGCRLKVWESAFLGWVSFSVIWSMLSGLPEGKGLISSQARGPLLLLGLEQRWGMFVPPPVRGGWHVIKGQTRQGEWVDLLHCNRSLREEKPEWIHSTYPTVRHYLHFANYLRSERDPRNLRRAAAAFYKRNWEQRFPEKLDEIVRVEIVHYRRDYTPGRGYSPLRRHLIWQQNFDLVAGRFLR